MSGRMRAANISTDDGSDGAGARVAASVRNRKKPIAPVEDVMFMDDRGRRLPSSELIQMVISAQALLPSSVKTAAGIAPGADAIVFGADTCCDDFGRPQDGSADGSTTGSTQSTNNSPSPNLSNSPTDTSDGCSSESGAGTSGSDSYLKSETRSHLSAAAQAQAQAQARGRSLANPTNKNKNRKNNGGGGVIDVEAAAESRSVLDSMNAGHMAYAEQEQERTFIVPELSDDLSVEFAHVHDFLIFSSGEEVVAELSVSFLKASWYMIMKHLITKIEDAAADVSVKSAVVATAAAAVGSSSGPLGASGVRGQGEGGEGGGGVPKATGGELGGWACVTTSPDPSTSTTASDVFSPSVGTDTASTPSTDPIGGILSLEAAASQPQPQLVHVVEPDVETTGRGVQSRSRSAAAAAAAGTRLRPSVSVSVSGGGGGGGSGSGSGVNASEGRAVLRARGRSSASGSAAAIIASSTRSSSAGTGSSARRSRSAVKASPLLVCNPDACRDVFNVNHVPFLYWEEYELRQRQGGGTEVTVKQESGIGPIEDRDRDRGEGEGLAGSSSSSRHGAYKQSLDWFVAAECSASSGGNGEGGREGRQQPASLAARQPLPLPKPAFTLLSQTKLHSSRQCLVRLFLFCLRQFIPVKYPSMSAFFLAYPQLLACRQDVELGLLKLSSNWFDLALFTTKSQNNKCFFMSVIPAMTEGVGAIYITGSGESQRTSDRVTILRQEGCLPMVKRAARSRKVGIGSGNSGSGSGGSSGGALLRQPSFRSSSRSSQGGAGAGAGAGRRRYESVASVECEDDGDGDGDEDGDGGGRPRKRLRCGPQSLQFSSAAHPQPQPQHRARAQAEARSGSKFAAHLAQSQHQPQHQPRTRVQAEARSGGTLAAHLSLPSPLPLPSLPSTSSSSSSSSSHMSLLQSPPLFYMDFDSPDSFAAGTPLSAGSLLEAGRGIGSGGGGGRLGLSGSRWGGPPSGSGSGGGSGSAFGDLLDTIDGRPPGQTYAAAACRQQFQGQGGTFYSTASRAMLATLGGSHSHSHSHSHSSSLVFGAGSGGLRASSGLLSVQEHIRAMQGAEIVPRAFAAKKANDVLRGFTKEGGGHASTVGMIRTQGKSSQWDAHTHTHTASTEDSHSRGSLPKMAAASNGGAGGGGGSGSGIKTSPKLDTLSHFATICSGSSSSDTAAGAKSGEGV